MARGDIEINIFDTLVIRILHIDSKSHCASTHYWVRIELFLSNARWVEKQCSYTSTRQLQDLWPMHVSRLFIWSRRSVRLLGRPKTLATKR